MKIEIDQSVDAMAGLREALVAATPSGGSETVAVSLRGLTRLLTRKIRVAIVKERQEGVGAPVLGSG